LLATAARSLSTAVISFSAFMSPAPSARLRASRAFASFASRLLKRSVVRCRSRRLPFLFCAIRFLLSAVSRPPVHRVPPFRLARQRVLSAPVFCAKSPRFLCQKRKKRRPPDSSPSACRQRHALGGTHFCAQSRGRNSFPLALLRLAGFRGAPQWALAKTGALRQPRLRCFVHWTRLARLPPGDKIWR